MHYATCSTQTQQHPAAAGLCGCGPRSDFAINFMEKQSFEKTESEAPTPPEGVKERSLNVHFANGHFATVTSQNIHFVHGHFADGHFAEGNFAQQTLRSWTLRGRTLRGQKMSKYF